ncbi:MAG: type II toxin-antitoxin system RelE/ParE family toxin [Aureliella sp.]
MPAERYHPLFVEDLASACKYYDDISPELGQRFRKRVRDSIASILERPESYGQIGGVYRGALLNGFPYVVVYSTADPSLTIYGLRHAASDRGNWFSRSLLPDQNG